MKTRSKTRLENQTRNHSEFQKMRTRSGKKRNFDEMENETSQMRSDDFNSLGDAEREKETL